MGEALASGLPLEMVLGTPGFLATQEGRSIAGRLSSPPLEVAPHLLDELTDADSPRGILAVARLPRGGAEALPSTGTAEGVYLFVDGLQDPGNLGAVVRVAEAAGVRGAALAPGSAHPNHPRALRASAGSLLRLPLAVGVRPGDVDRRLEALAPRWLALVSHGGRDLYGEPFDGHLVVALGAEGPGLSTEVRERADLAVTIPLAPPVESLNAAVAAAVVLFELRRRRRPSSC